MDIAIIIPAYNEEVALAEVMRAFHKELPEASLFVIDNNSSDRTNQIAHETMEELGAKGRVLFEGRQGKANAMRKAFFEVEADIYLLTDADMTYPAESVHDLLAPVVEGRAEMTVGDRLTSGRYMEQNKRPFHNFGNQLVRGLINTLFRENLGDIMSGYRAFSRRFIKNLPILCEGFEIETDMTIHALHHRLAMVEVPIHYGERPEGSHSKLSTTRDGLRVLKTIFWLFKDFKPLIFFTILAAFCFFLGLAIGAPVIYEFILTSYIAKVPSAILATGMMIFALIFQVIGIVLDTVVQYHARDFELRLLNDHTTHGRKRPVE